MRAIYVGSFNPFHKGHMDILRQAQSIFGEVTVAIGKNPLKDTDIERIAEELRGKLDCSVETYHGMIWDYLNAQKGDYVLVRGIRNHADLGFEKAQLYYIHHKVPYLRVAFIPCHAVFEEISSSAIRQLQTAGSDLWKEFVI